MGKIYLLHFDKKYKHAGHYLGYTEHLKERVAHHQNGTGATLTKYAAADGVTFIIARTWEKATRSTERKLKTSRHHSRLCPLCNPHAARRGQVTL